MNTSILESRVHRLERELKLQRWVTAGVLLAALAVAGIAATTQPASAELRTKRLIIVNDQGENAILLTGEKDGGAAVFYGVEGRLPMLIAGAVASGGEILLKTASGQNSVQVSAAQTGGQVLVSMDGKMRPIAGQAAK